MPAGNRLGVLPYPLPELQFLAASPAVQPPAPMPPKEVEAGEHKTSIAVWDLVCPLVIGRTAKMKVGAKCAADCQRTDHAVEIHDAAGKTIARAGLGGTPWPGTSALYWADVEFSAPEEGGTHTFSVTSEHGGVHSEFSFIAVKPPDHRLTIQVHEKTTKETIADVGVRVSIEVSPMPEALRQ